MKYLTLQPQFLYHLHLSCKRGPKMTLILLVFAFVLFAIAGFWNPPAPSPWFGRLVAAGLAFWVLTEILTRSPLHI